MNRHPFAMSVLSLLLSATSIAAPAPPSATVPVPTVTLSAVPAPKNWSGGRDMKVNSKLDFSIDLGLLAPLGNGKGNAALYLREFAPDGTRATVIEKDIHPVPSPFEPGNWMVLAPDHKLLLEAEPWVDQATCSFYPEVWPQRGVETKTTSVFHATVLGRSWVIRGNGATDAAAAMADYRRAVRLGRLLIQDDVWIGQDMLGRDLIALGARAMYERAKATGDAGVAAAALVTISECAWLKYSETSRIEKVEVLSKLGEPGFLSFVFGPTAKVDDSQFNTITEMATSAANRRHRLEAMVQLFLLKHIGAGDQDDKAAHTLSTLEKDRDPIVAEAAAYYRDAKKPEITQAAVIK